MKTPEPLYPCAAAECAEFGPFRPELLCRSETLGGWYCPDCFESRDELADEEGSISLADHLKQTVAVMPRELTAENGAKAALMGEFSETVTIDCRFCGGEGCPDCERTGEAKIPVPVTWPTIKDIYRKAIEHCEIKEKR